MLSLMGEYALLQDLKVAVVLRSESEEEDPIKTDSASDRSGVETDAICLSLLVVVVEDEDFVDSERFRI